MWRVAARLLLEVPGPAGGLLPGEGRHGSMKAAGWGNTQHGRLIAAPALVSN